jgi:hypothetical protein
MVLSLPHITYCGIQYGHSRWNRHLVKCDICRNNHENKKNILQSEWNIKCGCGCENITSYAKKYIIGHNSIGKKRTEDQKKHYRESFTDERRKKLSENAIKNNCMFKEEVVNKLKSVMISKYGVDNISKTSEFKRMMSENNPMYVEENKNKHLLSVRTDTFREKSRRNWIENNPSNNLKSLEKRINTYTLNLSEGKYAIKNNWKTGYFIKKDGTPEWYDSSLELKKMKYYEYMNFIWTKKHGIRIPYKNSKGINTYYVPDFLIIIDNIKILEETKGWMKKEILRKLVVTKDFCKKNKFAYNFYLNTIDNKIERYSFDYTA